MCNIPAIAWRAVTISLSPKLGQTFQRLPWDGVDNKAETSGPVEYPDKAKSISIINARYFPSF